MVLMMSCRLLIVRGVVDLGIHFVRHGFPGQANQENVKVSGAPGKLRGCGLDGLICVWATRLRPHCQVQRGCQDVSIVVGLETPERRWNAPAVCLCGPSSQLQHHLESFAYQSRILRGTTAESLRAAGERCIVADRERSVNISNVTGERIMTRPIKTTRTSRVDYCSLLHNKPAVNP